MVESFTFLGTIDINFIVTLLLQEGSQMVIRLYTQLIYRKVDIILLQRHKY